MKVLLAVITCRKFRHRADACRATWVQSVKDAQVRFFVGGHNSSSRDEVTLNVADDYDSLPSKIQAMCRWALEHRFDYVCKLDDDVYVNPARLLASGFEHHDYSGPRSPRSTPASAPYASGFAHWLSARSLEVLVRAKIDDWAEDRWTGKVLNAAGIPLHADNRYAMIQALSEQNLPLTQNDGPLASNDIIAAAELDSDGMHVVHRAWLQSLDQPVKRHAIMLG